MSRIVGPCLAALAALCALAQSSRADLVFLKDGFVLQGNVRREGTTEFDSGAREFIWMPKGFFLIDDGPRRVYFSPLQVGLVEKLTAPAEERIVRRDGKWMAFPRQMPPIEEIVEKGSWNYKTWERDFLFRSDKVARIGLKQKIAEINPYYARIDAITKFRWSCAVLTSELGPDVVRRLLLSHPELQDDYLPPRPPPRTPERLPVPELDEKGENGDWVRPTERTPPPTKPTDGQVVARRMRICDFFAQAGWYDLAEEELERLLKDFPQQKKRVGDAREAVGKLRARDEWEEIKNWYHAGRHAAVRKRLVAAEQNRHVTDRVMADMREMKARLAGDEEMLTQATAALDECAREVTTAQGRALRSAVAVIRKEMSPASVGRLDAFLGQARESARQKARGKKPVHSPDQLLALAVSGWLLGSPSAEAKAESAVNLWKTRQLILEYCQETDAASRKKILAQYEGDVTPRVELDEVAQLIDSLPPVEPGAIARGVTAVTVGKGRAATKYHLQLPPEYTHGRSYPVLIVLANGGEKPAAALARWEKAAADHGYILAAPEWEAGLKNTYTYSEREHDTVLNAVRDLRNRYQIDSDRVFLFGFGEGGKMAYDVGLSHPGEFAGIVPMNAGLKLFPRRYWRNAQYLPIYAITGTRAGDCNEGLRDIFTFWVQRGYPALWVEYKGRGMEWLGGEVANVFDWMRNQKRAFPLRQIGTDGNNTSFGNEFCTMRAEDNRFYWLSTTEIGGRFLNSAEKWSNLTTPAQMTARIDPESNEIHVRTSGLGQVTVWLGRNPKGQTQVDFDRTVVVRVGLRAMFNRKVTPSLAVMLEDLAKRGDRKHLFLARIDLKLR